MAWNKSGADRVKSYRIYQELEARHNEALEEIADLRTALNVKDELIRRLAAEIANIPKTPTAEQVDGLHEQAADAYSRNRSGPRVVVRPGAYSSVQDGSSEHDEAEIEIPPIDGLTHIRTPSKKAVPS
jgi:hypothetical protein